MAGREFYLWRARTFTAGLALDVIEHINAALADPRRRPAEEQGGILLGRITGPSSVEITSFEFFPSEHRRGIAYDLGLRERMRLTGYVRRLRRKRGEIPVGYFRTHHRPGLFLDQDDFSLMTEAFRANSCAALIVSALTGSAGFFFWEEDDMDRARTQLAFPFHAAALREVGPVISLDDAKSQGHRRLIPAWQALSMAVAAAVAGYGIVLASSRDANPPRPLVLVAVSVEPQSPSAAGLVLATPAPSIRPRVPDSLAAKLSRETPVDVRVSIDRNGVVRDTEVLNGGGSPFSSLASDNAFETLWSPAHQGQRRVPSEMIVHYLFTPASAERQ